jgi:endonuclease/exonuclease/phosphatase family metal-dependent hydrolase
MRLRILTMNVQNDAGDARRAGLLNRGLRALRPDVVAFQEVAYPAGPSQLDALLDGTGLHVAAGRGVGPRAAGRRGDGPGRPPPGRAAHHHRR